MFLYLMTPLKSYPPIVRVGKFLYRTPKYLSLMISNKKTRKSKGGGLGAKELDLMQRTRLSVMRKNSESTYDYDVLIVTDKPFWRRRLGNHQRIFAMIQHLRTIFSIRVLFTGKINEGDANEILYHGFHDFLDFLSDYSLPSSKLPRNKGAFGDYGQNGIRKEQFRYYNERFNFNCVIFNYLRLDYLIRGQNYRFYKFIDIHDVFHLRCQEFEKFGRTNSEFMTKSEEVFRLKQFDKVISIQSTETEYLRTLIDEEIVIEARHSLDYSPSKFRQDAKRVVFVAGASPHNSDGLIWFLESVWNPFFGESKLELHIFGRVCIPVKKHFDENILENVVMHGEIPDLNFAYEYADIVINPALYGSGLKIKCIEAIFHGLPLVCSAVAAQGIPEQVCLLVDSADEFADAINLLVSDSSKRRQLIEVCNQYAEKFGPSDCYKELVDSIREVSGREHRQDRVFPVGAIRYLVLGRPDSNAWYALTRQIKAFEKGVFVHEKDPRISSGALLSRLVREQMVDRIVIFNPYANERRLELYRQIRELGIPYIAFDRGALPDSWFFDANGFNADSVSYDPKKWERSLSKEEDRRVEDYINSQLIEKTALEKQGATLGELDLRSRLGIGDKKVIFVPFQRPDDTVIRHFTDDIGGMEGFVSFLNELSAALPQDWVIIGKKHPLEVDRLEANIMFVEDDTNIHDLLELCEQVLLINSGVGVISMLYRKPVIYCGEVFYGHSDINTKASNVDEVLKMLTTPKEPNFERIKQFIYYLVFEFYSFAKSDGFFVEEESGKTFTTTQYLDFYELRGV